MSNIAKQTTELKWYFDSSNKAQQLSKWNYYYLIVFRLWYECKQIFVILPYLKLLTVKNWFFQYSNLLK